VRLADFLDGDGWPPSPFCPLQLDEIVLRVIDVDRYALALGAKARANLPYARLVCLQVFHDLLDVERMDPQANVIHVASFLAGGSTAKPSKLAVYGHEIDHRVAGPEMHEPELRPAPLYAATQHRAVETDHPLDVADAQNHMVDVSDLEHGTATRTSLRTGFPTSAPR